VLFHSTAGQHGAASTSSNPNGSTRFCWPTHTARSHQTEGVEQPLLCELRGAVA
jgi:hypothetical protein